MVKTMGVRPCSWSRASTAAGWLLSATPIELHAGHGRMMPAAADTACDGRVYLHLGPPGQPTAELSAGVHAPDLERPVTLPSTGCWCVVSLQLRSGGSSSQCARVGAG